MKTLSAASMVWRSLSKNETPGLSQQFYPINTKENQSYFLG
ncbi:hypothetical protein [Dolichospermum circinale]|uniref:Uncharacterized protein n=1 Tax=Dolichospermum circinale CS-537/01 TaxID=3021739 RepID=A0ABT5A029_9CYAN|nr:hypothetical protein [Dolichospermum circinale]MDB9460200.1 hypothetical protein [Dolichospermum circinale CS-545/17]MDB9472881.1 hypothetical protein [Dolichospermum circinale CS-539]MDB9485275.1 hypothetical protein [Dolichospermum circinale CS-537/01]